MKPLFDDKIIEYYEEINKAYPKLIECCNNVFPSDIDKLKKYLSTQINDSDDASKMIDVVIDFVPEDPSDLTKYVISKLDKHLSYFSLLFKKNELRGFLLLKKRDYKKKVDKKIFNFVVVSDDEDKKDSVSTKRSEEVCYSWLKDNDKLILSDFYFFDKLSNTIKIPHLLSVLEYVLCDVIKEDAFSKFPVSLTDSMWIIDNRVYSSPLYEIRSDGNLNFYYEKIVDDDGENLRIKRFYIAEDVFVGKKIDKNIQDEEIALICSNYRDFCTPFFADEFTFNLCLIIYNMISFDDINNNFMIYRIDDVINKIDPYFDKNQKNLSASDRARRSLLKTKVLRILQDMHKYRVLNYSFNKKTGKANTDFVTNGAAIFQDTIITDPVKGIARTTLGYDIMDSWKDDTNNKVLSSDIEKLGNSVSKQALFVIQGYRVKSRTNNYEISLPLSTIKSSLTSLSSEKYNLTRIFDIFDSLKFNNILIKDYKRKDNIVTINFLPLNESELKIYNLI